MIRPYNVATGCKQIRLYPRHTSPRTTSALLSQISSLYRNSPAGCRFQSTSTSGKRAFYITTPIFYANAQPHVGHLYTLVLTDVIKRYMEFTGRPAIMMTGTDEHGMKIQAAAKAADKKPLAFCDGVAAAFQNLPRWADVNYDHFIRTTHIEHRAAVTHFWDRLVKKGFIFKASHAGWYSVSDETFYPDSAVEERMEDGRKAHYSIESGNVVEWTSEDNYHFRLSAMRDRLLEFYAENPDFITPQARFNDVISSVTEGLQDLSISRPSSRLTWAIPVPGDDSQTIYVWLDALVSYLTATGYPQNSPLWPADVHVIGKDIVRFHCIYWPAFLLAVGIKPPKKILSHSHWTMNNFKMSKSRGNVADPLQAIHRFGVDSVRYYLMRDGRLENDGNYSSEHLVLRHNHELVNGLGNLISRISAKSFNLAEILESPPDITKYQSQVAQLMRQTEQLVNSFHYNMSKYLVFKAVGDVVDMITNVNALLTILEPWRLRCAEKTRGELLYVALENVRIAALLLQPIMPKSMATLLDRLGVDPASRSSNYAVFGGDGTYSPLTEKFPHIFTTLDDGSKLSNAAKRRDLFRQPLIRRKPSIDVLPRGYTR